MFIRHILILFSFLAIACAEHTPFYRFTLRTSVWSESNPYKSNTTAFSSLECAAFCHLAGADKCQGYAYDRTAQNCTLAPLYYLQDPQDPDPGIVAMVKLGLPMAAAPGPVTVTAQAQTCIHVVPGSDYSFTCSEDMGYPRPSLTWYRNGNLDAITGSVFNITATSGDSEIKCRAENPIGPYTESRYLLYNGVFTMVESTNLANERNCLATNTIGSEPGASAWSDEDLYWTHGPIDGMDVYAASSIGRGWRTRYGGVWSELRGRTTTWRSNYTWDSAVDSVNDAMGFWNRDVFRATGARFYFNANAYSETIGFFHSMVPKRNMGPAVVCKLIYLSGTVMADGEPAMVNLHWDCPLTL